MAQAYVANQKSIVEQILDDWLKRIAGKKILDRPSIEKLKALISSGDLQNRERLTEVVKVG